METLQKNPEFQEVMLAGLDDEQCRPVIEKMVPEESRDQMKEMLNIQKQLGSDPEMAKTLDMFKELQGKSEAEQKEMMGSKEFMATMFQVMTQDKYKPLKEFIVKQQEQQKAKEA